MMVMTAKLNLKKILLILGAAAAVVLSLILMLGGSPGQGQVAPADDNQTRVQFLTEKGWDVQPAPTETSQVRIPKTTSQVYERYNNLQKSQGYDLTRYAGKKVLRCVYQVNNYPGATAPVFATLLVCDGTIIGGDITDTSPGGKIRGFQRPAGQQAVLPKPTAPTLPSPSEGAAETAASEQTH